MSGSTNKQEDEHHQQQQQQPDGGDTRDNIDSLAEPGVHDQAGNRAQGDPSNGRHASLDPGQAAAAAWEEQRRRWLTPKNSGRGLTSSTSNLARLNRISNPSSDLERSAADRGARKGGGPSNTFLELLSICHLSRAESVLGHFFRITAITIIKNRLADGHQLKEAMPLSLLVRACSVLHWPA